MDVTRTPAPGEAYGRYRLVRMIGRGGMGVVFEATDTSLSRAVAVKIIHASLADDPEYQERFAREAALLARVRSRHIVQVHDFGEHEGAIYLVTELFPDGDLQAHIKSNGPLARDVALRMLTQIAEGLADAHRVGVIHRDVKPSNVLLWHRDGELVPYLCDFGIAATGDSTLTQAGSIVGSLTYMAPERHHGNPADERSDIYSMGCLLWTMLSGEAPYTGTDFQVASAHISNPIPQRETTDAIDQAINELLLLTMAKDAGARIASAEALRRRLSEMISMHDRAAAPADVGADAIKVLESVQADLAAETNVRPMSAVLGALHDPIEKDPAREGLGSTRVALAAALGLALTAGAVGVALAVSDRDDPRPAMEQTAATPTATPPEPLPRPGTPSVKAIPGYRSVVFSSGTLALGSGVQTTLEINDGTGWREAAAQERVATDQGGTRVCASVRAVALDDTQVRRGPSVRVCGKSQPRRVHLVPQPGPCEQDGQECREYILEVEGFMSSQPVTVTLNPPEFAEVDCPPEGCLTSVPVGPNGRGTAENLIRWPIAYSIRNRFEASGVVATVKR